MYSSLIYQYFGYYHTHFYILPNTKIPQCLMNMYTKSKRTKVCQIFFQIDHMKNGVVNSQQSLEATNLYICKPLFLSFTYFVSNPTRYYTTYFWIYDFKIALHLSSSIQHLHKILVVFDSALFYNFHFICCNSFSNKQQ